MGLILHSHLLHIISRFLIFPYSRDSPPKYQIIYNPITFSWYGFSFFSIWHLTMSLFLIILEIYATSFYNLGISILITLHIIGLVLFPFWSHIIFLLFKSRESVLITFSCYRFSIFFVFVAHYFSSLNFFKLCDVCISSQMTLPYHPTNSGSVFDHGSVMCLVRWGVSLQHCLI